MSGVEQTIESVSDLDHRGERRLSARESFAWYSVAAVSYIAVGTWQKVLLTWFIGPAWLVVTLIFGPRLWDRIRSIRTRADKVTR